MKSQKNFKSEINWEWKHYNELTSDELYSILRIRQEVFIVEQKINCVDCDNLDQISYHFYATDINKNICAYLRIIPAGYKYPELSLGRVLVSSSHRGTGLGKELIAKAIIAVESRLNIQVIKISAQRYLEKFYKEFGFQTISDVYMEEGIEHIKMRREI